MPACAGGTTAATSESSEQQGPSEHGERLSGVRDDARGRPLPARAGWSVVRNRSRWRQASSGSRWPNSRAHGWLGRLDDSGSPALVARRRGRVRDDLRPPPRAAARVLPPHARQPPRRRGRAAADVPAGAPGAARRAGAGHDAPLAVRDRPQPLPERCWRRGASPPAARGPRARVRRPRRATSRGAPTCASWSATSRGCPTTSARRWSCSSSAGRARPRSRA